MAWHGVGKTRYLSCRKCGCVGVRVFEPAVGGGFFLRMRGEGFFFRKSYLLREGLGGAIMEMLWWEMLSRRTRGLALWTWRTMFENS